MEVTTTCRICVRPITCSNRSPVLHSASQRPSGRGSVYGRLVDKRATSYAQMQMLQRPFFTVSGALAVAIHG